VVILSGSDSPEAVRHAYESGACAYVLKQSQIAEMRITLGRIFDFWLGSNLLLN
jgi:DNA-binding NarL/FixJ family response regulator